MCHSLGPLVRSDEIMRVKGCRYISFQDAGEGDKRETCSPKTPGRCRPPGSPQ